MAAKVRWYRDAWWVRTHAHGRRSDKRLGPTKADKIHAQTIAREINAKLVLGNYQSHPPEKQDQITFQDFAELWLSREIDLPFERRSAGHVAAGTARTYRLQIEKHLVPFFDDFDLRTFKRSDIQRFYDHCIDSGRPRSPKSIDMAINVLRMILGYAEGQELIETNPVEAWKRGRKRRRASSTVTKIERTKVFTAEELTDLLNLAAEEFTEHHPLLLFLAHTGARIGEASALRWEDVDLEGGTARIARSFSSDIELGPTKTGRERIVELSNDLVHTLARFQPNVFPIPEGLLVFPAENGGFLRAANFRERVFKKLVRATVGPHRGLSPHSLRHTWASLHMARSTPLKWIQEQGGWASAKVLLDTYGHFMPSESHGYADAIMGSNGSGTAPTLRAANDLNDQPAQPPETAEDLTTRPFAINPRSPIMHLTEPPPFFRNSLTSTVMGVTPRSRT
ncbi:MAG: site-specific integrase [Myxococcales bacterium]|nr:site-specific integrase [Myxococcales bacterium]